MNNNIVINNTNVLNAHKVKTIKHNNYLHGINYIIYKHPKLMIFCFMSVIVNALLWKSIISSIHSNLKKMDPKYYGNIIKQILIFTMAIMSNVFAFGAMGDLIKLNITNDFKLQVTRNILTCDESTITKHNIKLMKLYKSSEATVKILTTIFTMLNDIISIILSIYDIYIEKQDIQSIKIILLSIIVSSLLLYTTIVLLNKYILKIEEKEQQLSKLNDNINIFENENIKNSLIVKISSHNISREKQYIKYLQQSHKLGKELWLLRTVGILSSLLSIPLGILTFYYCSAYVALTQLLQFMMLSRHLVGVATKLPLISKEQIILNENNNMINTFNFEEQNSKNKKTIKSINIIEARNLNFTIGNRTIKGSFKINSKDSVAIVGKSGSGKTTLLKLLMGTIPHKNIIINNKPMNTLDINNYRKQITYIHQSPLLFTGTIEDNLSITGINNIKKYDEVAKSVGLYNRIHNDKLKYNQLISNTTLSGGEKQRLSMMICLLKPKYSMVVFDEPTSNLDYFNKILFDNLVKKLFYKKATLLWIDHNRDIVDIVDYVIFIDNSGQIHYDTHRNLIKNNKEYNNYFNGNDIDYSDKDEITIN